MNRKYLKSQNGAMTLFVLLAMMFFVTFILGIYTMTSAKNKAQVESLAEVKSMYKKDADTIYNAKIAADDDVIPIYTEEQLKWVGEGKILEIDGKIYEFKDGTATKPVTYIIKSPIYVSVDYQIKTLNYGSVDENNNLIRETGYIVDNNKTINGEVGSYNNPTIPVGFRPINTDEANWANLSTDWDKGLVIEDKQANQFVWVPVDGTSVTYSKWCIAGIDYEDTNLSTPPFPGSDKTSLFKGFWIARYEAGITAGYAWLENTTNNRNNLSGNGSEPLPMPVSQQGRVPWNYISYSTSKTLAESVYTSNAHLQSALATGVQYDTIMKWIKNAGFDVDTDSSNWGNYRNSSILLNNSAFISTNGGVNWTNATQTTNGVNQIIRTGASEETKAKNIYDLAGNLWEWTGEAYSSEYINRGGDYLDGSNNLFTIASYRRNSPANTVIDSVGFRIVLYLK